MISILIGIICFLTIVFSVALKAQSKKINKLELLSDCNPEDDLDNKLDSRLDIIEDSIILIANRIDYTDEELVGLQDILKILLDKPDAAPPKSRSHRSRTI